MKKTKIDLIMLTFAIFIVGYAFGAFSEASLNLTAWNSTNRTYFGLLMMITWAAGVIVVIKNHGKD